VLDHYLLALVPALPLSRFRGETGRRPQLTDNNNDHPAPASGRRGCLVLCLDAGSCPSKLACSAACLYLHRHISTKMSGYETLAGSSYYVATMYNMEGLVPDADQDQGLFHPGVQCKVLFARLGSHTIPQLLEAGTPAYYYAMQPVWNRVHAVVLTTNNNRQQLGGKRGDGD